MQLPRSVTLMAGVDIPDAILSSDGGEQFRKNIQSRRVVDCIGWT